MAGPIPIPPQKYRDIINACDNFRVSSTDEPLVPWHLTPEPTSPAIGLLRPAIVAQLHAENERRLKVWQFGKDICGRDTVSFAASVGTSAQRTRVMKEMCERWRDEGLWADIIGPKKWRGELYPVYRNPFGAHDAPEEDLDDVANEGSDWRNYAFMVERAACALFGVVTYGVHMTIYEDSVDASGAHSCRIWVPTRARTKQTWPGYLDNSVAGGIPCGLSAFESLVKESMEEASIAESVVRKHARAAGSVSYFFRTGAGWLQPEVEYTYDLRVPAGADVAPFQPKPLDGEVESFELLPLDEVIMRMRTGLFKRNCALVLVDFMIRHGYLAVEAEPDFLEIVTRLHGRFDYDKW